MVSGLFIAEAMPAHSKLAMAWHTARWVDKAPLGAPVVPEV